jgi:hypothetical protein
MPQRYLFWPIFAALFLGLRKFAAPKVYIDKGGCPSSVVPIGARRHGLVRLIAPARNEGRLPRYQEDSR